MRVLTLVSILFVLPFDRTNAEQSKQFDDYVIHYNAITTNLLTPAVASTYGIKRSKSRALLNIAVLNTATVALGEPIEALVEVKARNLNGQNKTIAMRLVSEQDARYYIGEVNIANLETLRFELTVTPAGSDRSYPIQFDQQFYID